MTDSSTLSNRVRDQYEQYPYPDAGSAPGLLISGHLSLMCDLLWCGQKSPDGLRVLDAGCGTGSALVAMAKRYPEADIVGVDFSSKSLQHARQLAKKYYVNNIRFFNLPIQQLPELGLSFDFVVSSGVLHHLPDPAAGLNAIRQVLDPQGAVSIMLYGKYGRTGIYMLQEALSRISKTPVTAESIRFAHRVAQLVPPHHPMSSRAKGREMQEGKDSGIVDLLLHANDIPFDVPAVYRMCDNAHMKFLRWLFPVIYNPYNFFDDPLITRHIKQKKLTEPQRQEMAELAHGRNSKHSFFAVPKSFKSSAPLLENGNWRALHCKLTPCMAWNRTAPVHGETDTFAVPFTIIQDAWAPLKIKRWELLFLSRILPKLALQEVLEIPEVRQVMPYQSEGEINHAVETLLKKAMDRLAIVFVGG